MHMKAILLLCTALFFILAGEACEDEASLNPLLYGSIENDTVRIGETAFLTMYAEPEKYPLRAGKISLMIENSTVAPFTYGTYYTMEYFNGRDWKPFKLDIMFTDLGLSVRPGTKNEEEITLHHHLHTYAAGKYRIKKSFYTPQIVNGNNVPLNCELSAEFVLED
jgi:hypothetical protein